MPHPYRYLPKSTPQSLITQGEVITGVGEVWEAVNAYCFTGPYSDGGCRMCIPPNATVFVGYGDVSYRYFGPTEVCIGSGGAGGRYPNYVTTADDWAAIGTTNHAVLTGRDVVDSHPQAAITGLVAEQNTQNSRLDAIEAELIRLEQDKLDTANALQLFSFAAYGEAECPNDTAFSDLGAAWQDLDIFTVSNLAAPRGVVINLTNGQFSVENSGVYAVNLSGAIEHDISQSGRITYVRLYNYTAASAVGAGIALGTGRNAAATSVVATLLADIGATHINQALGFQIGDGDTYTAVTFQTLGYSVNAEGEWRGAVGAK